MAWCVSTQFHATGVPCYALIVFGGEEVQAGAQTDVAATYAVTQGNSTLAGYSKACPSVYNNYTEHHMGPWHYNRPSTTIKANRQCLLPKTMFGHANATQC